MNAVISPLEPTASADAMSMRETLEAQRQSFLDELPVSIDRRIDRIERLIALLKKHQDAFCAAMDEDFGGRPRLLSKMTDVAAAVGSLEYARANAAAWMEPDHRKVRFPLNLLGAKAWVEYQPKGVVGVISPWNYPVMLAFAPLGAILAAGNRAMIKPSEHTPRTSAVMAETIGEYFDNSEVAVFTGEADVGQAFAALPFDHLLFTGATSIGRHIMRASAENLTPVTLELGGKSPTIIGKGADLAKTAERIVLGKMMNAGQTCLAPDYLLVSKDQQEPLVQELEAAARRIYPTIANNEHYAQIISDRHAERLRGYVEEARDAGADLRVLQEPDQQGRRLPLTLAIDPAGELEMMREEIFGPILPILTYQSLDQAIAHINAGDRPLGLYYFGSDKEEERAVLDRTISGGVTLNDVIYHITAEDAPFGGSGASGIGAYHGPEGFRTFSHAKTVYRQSPLNLAKLAGLIPPYGKKLQRMVEMDLGKPPSTD